MKIIVRQNERSNKRGGSTAMKWVPEGGSGVIILNRVVEAHLTEVECKGEP